MLDVLPHDNRAMEMYYGAPLLKVMDPDPPMSIQLEPSDIRASDELVTAGKVAALALTPETFR